MITDKTTLAQLEVIAREHHLISVLFERAPNHRSGVAARIERDDRVVVVKSGATVADALALALAEMITRPSALAPAPIVRPDPYAKDRCPSCRNTDPNVLGSGREPCRDPWHEVKRTQLAAGWKL